MNATDLPVAASRQLQVLTVRALAPLSAVPGFTGLVTVGIRTEDAARRAWNGWHALVCRTYGLGRRSDLVRLREQVRALEHRLSEVER